MSLIAQPQYPLDASFDDLPEHLVRKCCVGRDCGNTDLEKVPVFTKDMSGIGYRRSDTGELYFGPYAAAAELVAMVNRDTFWPAEGDDGNLRPVR